MLDIITSFEVSNISRKKHNSATIIAPIEEIKLQNTIYGILKPDSTKTNKLAIDTQTSSAPNVAKPIVTRNQVMRFTVNSNLCSWRFSGAKALTILARTIARPKRPHHYI